jgi:hypothetical protein
LRNHEIVWAARSDAPVADFYKMVYGERTDAGDALPDLRHPTRLAAAIPAGLPQGVEGSMHFEELKPIKRKLIKQILANGPVSPGELEAERIVGGFNTVKATTKALEHLFYEGKVQVSGSTKNFHRQFDVTEHVAPELLKHPRFKKGRPRPLHGGIRASAC